MTYKDTLERAAWLRGVSRRDELQQEELRKLTAELLPKAPYPFCGHPEKCIPAHRCVRDWVCND